MIRELEIYFPYGSGKVGRRGVVTAGIIKKEDSTVNNDLKYIVIKGLKEEASITTRELLETMEELEVVNNMLIPALDEVGQKYEKVKFSYHSLYNNRNR